MLFKTAAMFYYAKAAILALEETGRVDAVYRIEHRPVKIGSVRYESI
jgi:hypothetical protein